MQSKIITSCLVAGVLFAGGSALRAQTTNAPEPRPGAPGSTLQPRMRPLPPSGQQGGLMSVLNEDQRNSYTKAMEASRDKMMDLRTQLVAAQREVADAIVTTNKFDENLVREKAMAQARIQAEMTVLNAKMFSEIEPPLTSEQIERLKGPPAPMMRPMPARPPSAATNPAASGMPPKQ